MLEIPRTQPTPPLPERPNNLLGVGASLASVLLSDLNPPKKALQDTHIFLQPVLTTNGRTSFVHHFSLVAKNNKGERLSVPDNSLIARLNRFLDPTDKQYIADQTVRVAFINLLTSPYTQFKDTQQIEYLEALLQNSPRSYLETELYLAMFTAWVENPTYTPAPKYLENISQEILIHLKERLQQAARALNAQDLSVENAVIVHGDNLQRFSTYALKIQRHDGYITISIPHDTKDEEPHTNLLFQIGENVFAKLMQEIYTATPSDKNHN